MEKAREFQKNNYFCFIDYAKAFVWITIGPLHVHYQICEHNVYNIPVLSFYFLFFLFFSFFFNVHEIFNHVLLLSCMILMICIIIVILICLSVYFKNWIVFKYGSYIWFVFRGCIFSAMPYNISVKLRHVILSTKNCGK